MPSFKKPGVRLAKYEKLIHRFFEVLILAHFIKRVHGPHITVNHDLSTPAGVRRRFLKNLAFLCDYKKGGPSTTGISVEDRHDCYVAWLASNEGASSEVVTFVESVLANLRAAPSGEEKKSQETSLLQMATTFARIRVFKEWKMLVRFATKALVLLDNVGYQGTGLDTWLKQFQIRRGQIPTSICHLAYEIRKDEQIDAIKQLHYSSDNTLNPDFVKHLKWVAHFVGRLAARVRAVKELIDDAARLEHSLTNPWVVKAVSVPESAPVPEADRNTKLRGILNRMVDAGEPDYERLCDCIEKIDQACSLTDGILSKHADGQYPLRPVVHCEVQLTDHFHNHGLVYWEDDPYIACSKRACLLCRLYMEYHPFPFVETDSHNKIPLNWGSAILSDGANDPRFTCQRNILIAIIKDIRGPILKQISTTSSSSTFQADSLDELTQLEEDPFDYLDSDSAFLTEPEGSDLDWDLDEVAAAGFESHSSKKGDVPVTDNDTSDSDSVGGARL